MVGTVKVSTWRTNPTRRLPLSKARRAGQQAHRAVGTPALSRYEQRVADLVYSMYQAMPLPPTTLDGAALAAYDRELLDTLVEFHDPIRDLLQEQVDTSGTLATQELARQLSDDYRRVGKAADPLPSDLVLNLSFDRANPRALAFASEEAGRLVSNMVAEQRAVVRDVIADAYRANQAPGSTARQLRQVLATARPGTPEAQQVAELFGANVNGLTTQYERAVVNRAGALAADLSNRGVVGDKAYNAIRSDTERYANKLRRTRATTIARTETIRANNAGRMASYQQAADDGFLSKQHSVKQWEVSPFDVCPICVGLGQGKPIKLDDYFQAGAVAVQYPPAHPNCRCTFNVVPNTQMYDTPSMVGTGEPGDPYRFSQGFGPRGVDTGRVPANRLPRNVRPGSAPNPRPTPDPGEVLVDPAGKVPGHIIEPTGRVRLVDADEYRDPTGQWFRRRANASQYEEFRPSRNSGAGQVDRAVRSNPDKYRPSGTTPPSPTPPPAPTPAPAVEVPAPAPPSDLTVPIPESARRGTKILRDSRRYDDLLVPETMAERAARHGKAGGEWTGGTLSDEAQKAIDHLRRTGRKVREKIDEVAGQRLAAVEDNREVLQAQIDDLGRQREAVLATRVNEDKARAVLEQALADPDEVRNTLEFMVRYSNAIRRRDGKVVWSWEMEDVFRKEAMRRYRLEYWEVTDEMWKTIADDVGRALFDNGGVDLSVLERVLEIDAEVKALHRARVAVVDRLNEVRRQAAREVLGATRPGFGTGDAKRYFTTIKGKAGTATKQEMVEALDDAARNMPKEWLDHWDDAQSFDRRGWSLSWVNRGFYNQAERKVRLSGGNWRSTLQHELQHGVQGTNTPLYLAERAWLKMRVDSNPGGVAARRSWAKNEVGYKIDGLPQYTSREYLESKGYRGFQQATEVSTTGMEAFWHTQSLKRMDTDWEDFILGLLVLL
jgi:hypothetical protein